MQAASEPEYLKDNAAQGSAMFGHFLWHAVIMSFDSTLSMFIMTACCHIEDTAMQASVYRIDKFIVPEAANPEFLARVEETHRILRDCPGFVRDDVFEQYAGSGRFNLMTIVEWASQEAIEGAIQAVEAAREAEAFDPRALMARLGISADMALYRSVRN
jgi:heme-degrading monooxygenase HmoA